MRQLIIGDVHINEKSIEELNLIFTEIYTKYVEGETYDKIIQLGDYYDTKKPTAKEIDFGTYWVEKFNKAGHFVMVMGNHPEVEEDMSSVHYLRHYGSIELVEEYKIDHKYLYGHFLVDGSNTQYGDVGKYRKPTEYVKGYKIVMLGHAHDYQEMPNNVYHLGSVRYTSFNETASKYIAIQDEDALEFVGIDSCYKLATVYALKDLDNIRPNTKVRVIFKDFEQFKEDIVKVAHYKTKFVDFKIKLDFKPEDNKPLLSPVTTNLQEIVDNWIANIADLDVQKEIQNVFTQGIPPKF